MQLLERIRKHPIWVAITLVFAIFASLVAFLNQLPDFFDTTFPWMGKRVAVLGVTTQQILAAIVMAVAFVLFAVVIISERERCPDPSAHSLPDRQTGDPRQLRSVLRQIRDDLQFDLQAISRALETSQLWRYSQALRNGAWKKNRRQLDSLSSIGSLYDALSIAFGHVDRIKKLDSGRLRNRQVQPGDDFDGALATLKAARSDLEARLKILDGAVPQIASSKAAKPSPPRGGAGGGLSSGEPTVAEIKERADWILAHPDTNLTVSETMLRGVFGAPPFGPHEAWVQAKNELIDERRSSEARPRHELAAVGRKATCTCGQTFATGPEFSAHQREES